MKAVSDEGVVDSKESIVRPNRVVDVGWIV